MLQWITKTLGYAPRSRKPVRPSARPMLEWLEDRWTPTSRIYSVMNLNDAGAGSLRAAISAANAALSTQASISFSSTLKGTISLDSALPALNKDININGPTSSTIEIAGSGGVGGASFRLFTINAGKDCWINNLTLRDGWLDTGNGAAIYNDGTLTLSDLDIYNNYADGNGGAIYNSSLGTMEIIGCDIRLNHAASGGAIWNNNQLTITSSQIYSNTAGFGGGIANQGSGTVQAWGVDVFANFASVNGGGVVNYGSFSMSGGMLYSNSCTDNGGGILVSSGGSASFDTVAVNSNSADKGGGFYVGTGSIAFTGGSLTGNSSSSNAMLNGGAYDASNGTYTLDPSVAVPDAINSF